MLIAVIESVANGCRKCEEPVYSRLEWLRDTNELIDWVRKNTSEGFYIKEVWDETTKEKLPLWIEYSISLHHIVGVSIYQDNCEKQCRERIAYIYRNPYGDNLPWSAEIND